MHDSSVQARLAHWQTRVNQAIERTLNQAPSAIMPNAQAPEKLHQAMGYALTTPGKRLRPALIYAMGEALQCPDTALDHMAVAIECMHAYSLVHDDLPQMDNDDWRRGQPTVHKQYDTVTAILVGDALQSLAFEVLTQTPQVKAATQVALLQTLAQAAGQHGMVGGQSMDMDATRQQMDANRLSQLHQMKTGALITCACLMPSLPHPQAEALKPILLTYGHALGLAFQIQDDLLDTQSHDLGKTPGKDQQQNKATYVTLWGKASAEKACQDWMQTAFAQLKKIKEVGIDTDGLETLTHWMMQRTH